MKSSFLPQLLWYGRVIARRLGPPGMTGVALLACVVMWYVVVLRPAQHIVRNTRQAAALQVATDRRLALLPRSEKVPDQAERLSDFYRALGTVKQVPDGLGVLYAVARAKQLALGQGDYRLTRDPDGKLIRYEITLPVKATYPQIRGFLAQALNELPYLALRGVTFQRQKTSDPMLDCQIRFTMYLGAKS